MKTYFSSEYIYFDVCRLVCHVLTVDLYYTYTQCRASCSELVRLKVLLCAKQEDNNKVYVHGLQV